MNTNHSLSTIVRTLSFFKKYGVRKGKWARREEWDANKSANVEVAFACVWISFEHAIDDRVELHSARVFAEVVLRLAEEQVATAVTPTTRDTLRMLLSCQRKHIILDAFDVHSAQLGEGGEFGGARSGSRCTSCS